MAFRPALVVVDVQEDFCPPSGSLKVAEGRDIAPIVNYLLAMPSFVHRVATQDWHPANHISFASNHEDKAPYVGFATVVNPKNPSEIYETRLWPDHCVQDTKGAEIIPELKIFNKGDPEVSIVKKGTDPRVEMYSAFYDPLQNPRCVDSGLAGALKDKGVTHVYVVGLAFDYCVRATAVDAAQEGFTTYVIKEATRAVDPSKWAECEAGLAEAGVKVVSMRSPEVARLRDA